MKTPKEFYLVIDQQGRMWAGYNGFTTRPWQAKLYTVKQQAEKTANRFQSAGCRVVRARVVIDFLEDDE